VKFRRSLSGDATLRNVLQLKLFDCKTFETSSSVATGGNTELVYEVVAKLGRNQKKAGVV